MAQVERVGQILVLVGFLGLAAALLRYILTQFPVEDLAGSFKSFWTGGTYFLVVATFAVPGFALWVQGLIGRDARPRNYLLPVSVALLYALLLLPTGQRGFLIALGVMVLAILLGNRVIGTKSAAGIVVVGVLLIGLSQAARNEANETNRITIDGFLERIQPENWRDLYANQMASVNWTSLVAQNRSALDINNSFLELLAKPIPRSIYPDKSQGFGSEFTEKVFPEASQGDISFATPLVAESDYNFGPVGVVIIMGLLGFICVAIDHRYIRRAPRLVEPIAVATVMWVAFEFVRGDAANALVFSSGWVVPLLLFSRGLGLRDRPEIKKLVVDALQVAPKFSGIGRRVAEIGNSLKQQPLDLSIEVWCPANVKNEMIDSFPDGTRFRCPIKSSRPRVKRIIVQNLYGPLRASASSAVFSPGDQAPVWGRAPSILAVHDVRRLAWPDTAVSQLEARYYRDIMRIGAIRAGYLLTISRFSKSELERHLRFEAPVSIVSEQPTDAEPISIESLATREPWFLVVGALRKYKGLETVIAAVAKLGRSDVRVLVVGDAEENRGYLDELRQVAETSGVDEQIQLPGWVSDEQLRSYYQEVIATVNPSTYEGYGMAISESIAVGLPTIASGIPPHREIGGDAVRYFEKGDSGQLAEIMDEILREPELRMDLARAARSRHHHLLESDKPWAAALSVAVGALSGEQDSGDSDRESSSA